MTFMNIDLNAMSRKELMKLKRDVEKAIRAAERKEKIEALKAAERAAAEYGFSLSELSDVAKPKGPDRSKSAPKYRNPDNPSQTWTGRGRKPAWFLQAVERGVDISELEI